jgi:2'-5' RNA ligase
VRLFVAVNLPADERRRAWAAAAPLRAAHLPVRWVAEDAIHVTLRFLGEVEPDRVAGIQDGLGGAVRAARPFPVTIGGVGAFPSLDKPRVVWLGIEHHPALELLANDVELALMGLSFEPELRPFSPHVTLGRVARNARRGAFADFARLAGDVDYAGSTVVESVDLMQSTLGPNGASYTVLSRAALGGAAGTA